jgi:glycosyltransferase involved in cell wall biosynthesis
VADSETSPLVSVVLPTLNGSRYIAASIGSVLGQTYRNLELIVVDGGSTDGTLEIVAGVADARLKLVRQRDNADRLPGALNDGFALATGTYFTWAQDDDLFAPEAFAVMVRALDQRADVGLVYTGFQFIDENGAVIRAATLGPPEGLTASNVVGHCFLYRRTLAEQVGRYDPKFIMSEDTHFWLRAYRCGRLLYLPGSYYFHRLHPDSLTVRDYGRYQSLRVAARARREVLGISRRAYARQVSSAYIEEAFAAYAAGDLRRVRRCLAPALLRNPTWLRNRGVWSIGLRSLVARTSPRSRGRSASS